jgi:hypothetical protein
MTGLLLQPEEAVVPLPGILPTAITAAILAVVRSRVQARQLQESHLAMNTGIRKWSSVGRRFTRGMI